MAGSPCPPVIPGTYNGRVTINGQPVPDGTVVVASVAGIEWGRAVTAGGRYVIDIPDHLPAAPPCFEGGTVAFRSGTLTALERPVWGPGLHDLDLTFGAAQPRAGERDAKPGAGVPGGEVEPHDDILLILDSRGDEMVSAAEIGAALNIDVSLVEGYLDELEPEGVVTVARTFGGYSAFITPRGRVRVNRVRRGRRGTARAAPPAPAPGGEGRDVEADAMDSALREYFVAHEFTPEKTDDLRRAIGEALEDSGLIPYYADNEVKEGHIFINKILPKIRATRFGIYDLSNPDKANVFMELGAAIAMERRYFIICERGTKLPSDVLGLDRIEYEGYVDLTRQLKAKVTSTL